MTFVVSVCYALRETGGRYDNVFVYFLAVFYSLRCGTHA